MPNPVHAVHSDRPILGVFWTDVGGGVPAIAQSWDPILGNWGVVTVLSTVNDVTTGVTIGYNLLFVVPAGIPGVVGAFVESYQIGAT